jgi:hypothetical protein
MPDTAYVVMAYVAATSSLALPFAILFGVFKAKGVL